MTTRDIEAHLTEMYGVDVSPTLISSVTDVVMEEVVAWKSRPPQTIYPLVYLDALSKSGRTGRSKIAPYMWPWR